MICTRCAQPMARYSTAQGESLITTHLCERCFARTTTKAPNPRYVPVLVEQRPPNKQARYRPWTPMPEDA